MLFADGTDPYWASSRVLEYLSQTQATLPAEVASLGGMVRQYQLVLHPDRMRALNISHQQIIEAVQQANQEGGGSMLEMSAAEYMVRTAGYLKTLADFNHIVTDTRGGVPILLSDVAQVRLGPEMRRGVAELNGGGEVAVGIVIMRYGKNTLDTINGVKNKLADICRSLPPDVDIVPVYDRSHLIEQAIDSLSP